MPLGVWVLYILSAAHAGRAPESGWGALGGGLSALAAYVARGLIPMALWLAAALPPLFFATSRARSDLASAEEAIVLRGFALIGAKDVTLFFASELTPVPSWRPAPPVVGLR